MKRCIKFSLVTLLGAFLLGQLAAKQKDTAEQEPAKGKEPHKINIPIPIGHEGKGMKVPSFDANGKLQMMFYIQLAKRIDDDHLQMANLKIEMYGNPDSDLTIDFPNSSFNLNTRVISSKDPVTIRRSDFEITGETMEFNTNTRVGKFSGKIKMLIYNRDVMMPEETAQ